MITDDYFGVRRGTSDENYGNRGRGVQIVVGLL